MRTANVPELEVTPEVEKAQEVWNSVRIGSGYILWKEGIKNTQSTGSFETRTKKRQIPQNRIFLGNPLLINGDFLNISLLIECL